MFGPWRSDFVQVKMMTIRKSQLFNYSFSLILCELSESVLLFSGVFLFAFGQGEAIGVIGLLDTFLLCCFAIGNALADSYHNFYARTKHHSRLPLAKGVFNRSIRIFLGQGLKVFVLTALLGALLSGWMSSDSIEMLLGSLPFLLLLVLVFFLGLSHHALLVGMGQLKTVGVLALISIVLNTSLVLSFQVLGWDSLDPVKIVLLSGIISEMVWVILLRIQVYRWFRAVPRSPRKSLRVDRVVIKAAFLPGLSVFFFYLFTYLFMGYLTICCASAELMYFSMVFALWSVMMAPANGVYEAALHLFSKEWSSGNLERFEATKRAVTTLSFLLSLGVFFSLSWVLIYTMPEDRYLLLILGLLPGLALLNSQTKFGFLSLFVQLKIARFSRLKVLYALLIFVFMGLGYFLFELNTLNLIISLVLGQIVLCLLLTQKKNWKNWLLPQFATFPLIKSDLYRT
ncbi:hypothetical protein [Algoriphagus confluentis]|uniref:Membrane protein involved in the export of O-antigen and teichoic acid n=1 Tax=Algoriphagus confluentis TaxID=1697556 RepID=A0ABQ6PS34_9BACT|nr:hypothetical protein Aconfl_30940 [Algoriphagus confluentis]